MLIILFYCNTEPKYRIQFCYLSSPKLIMRPKISAVLDIRNLLLALFSVQKLTAAINCCFNTKNATMSRPPWNVTLKPQLEYFWSPVWVFPTKFKVVKIATDKTMIVGTEAMILQNDGGQIKNLAQLSYYTTVITN